MVYQCTKYKIGQDTPQRCWQEPRITPISNIKHLHLKKGVKMSSYLRTIDIDRYLNSTLSELYISDFFPTQTNLILHNIETSDYELCWTLKKMKRPRKDRKKIYRWRPCTRLAISGTNFWQSMGITVGLTVTNSGTNSGKQRDQQWQIGD